MKIKAVLMPGQGSAYVGMGKTLCEKYEIARKTFEEASEAISCDLKKMCFVGDFSEIVKTENSQPAILTTSVAAFRVLQENTDIKPHYYAGHSLGEFSALTCAEAIDLADAVRLVRKRGELMATAVKDTDGLMTAVGKLPMEMVAEVCNRISEPGNIVCISNYNSAKQNVISGNQAAVIEAEKQFSAMGASLKRLNVSAPFHSPLMQPAAEEFKQVLKEYEFRKPVVPVLSNVTARPHVAEEIKAKLAEQIVSPVRWEESMEYLKEQKIRMAIEVGPGKVLKNLMRANFSNVKSLAYDVSDDAFEIEKLVLLDKAVPFVSRCMGLAVASKNLCTDNSYYEQHVVVPYRKLQDMQEKIEKEERQASMDEARDAKELLVEILNAKMVDKAEIEQKLNRLFIDTEVTV